MQKNSLSIDHRNKNNHSTPNSSPYFGISELIVLEGGIGDREAYSSARSPGLENSFLNGGGQIKIFFENFRIAAVWREKRLAKTHHEPFQANYYFLRV